MNLTNKVHMGQALELIIRKNELNLSELAQEVGVDRRTFYYWFKKSVLKESTIDKISRVIKSEDVSNSLKRSIIEPCFEPAPQLTLNRTGDAYWKDKYLVLLERYTQLLKLERRA
jgi:AcrR family transcriptional regulator